MELRTHLEEDHLFIDMLSSIGKLFVYCYLSFNIYGGIKFDFDGPREDVRRRGSLDGNSTTGDSNESVGVFKYGARNTSHSSLTTDFDLLIDDC